jgi:hypothetical protein
MEEITEYGSLQGTPVDTAIWSKMGQEHAFTLNDLSNGTPILPAKITCKDGTMQSNCSKNGGVLDCTPKQVTYTCQNGTTETKTEFDPMCPEYKMRAMQMVVKYPPCYNAGGIKQQGQLIPDDVQMTIEGMVHYYSNTDKLALLGVVAVGVLLLLDNE